MFSEKLVQAMKSKKMSRGDIAAALYNGGSDCDLWKKADIKTKKNYKRKVDNWCTGTVPRNVTDIEKLCQILDCDFSFFFNEEPLQNLNNKKVADFLGLNEEVISHIKNYSDYEKKFLSLLIRADEFNKGYGDLLQLIIDILGLHADSSSFTTITIENSALEETTVLKGGDTLDYIMNATRERMDNVILKVTDIGIGLNRIRYENVAKKEGEEIKKERENLEKNC